MKTVTILAVVNGREYNPTFDIECLTMQDLVSFADEVYPLISTYALGITFDYLTIKFDIIDECDVLEEEFLNNLSSLFVECKINVPLDAFKSFGHYLQFISKTKPGIPLDMVRFSLPAHYR